MSYQPLTCAHIFGDTLYLYILQLSSFSVAANFTTQPLSYRILRCGRDQAKRGRPHNDILDSPGR